MRLYRFSGLQNTMTGKEINKYNITFLFHRFFYKRRFLIEFRTQSIFLGTNRRNVDISLATVMCS